MIPLWHKDGEGRARHEYRHATHQACHPPGQRAAQIGLARRRAFGASVQACLGSGRVWENIYAHTCILPEEMGGFGGVIPSHDGISICFVISQDLAQGAGGAASRVSSRGGITCQQQGHGIGDMAKALLAAQLVVSGGKGAPCTAGPQGSSHCRKRGRSPRAAGASAARVACSTAGGRVGSGLRWDLLSQQAGWQSAQYCCQPSCIASRQYRRYSLQLHVWCQSQPHRTSSTPPFTLQNMTGQSEGGSWYSSGRVGSGPSIAYTSEKFSAPSQQAAGGVSPCSRLLLHQRGAACRQGTSQRGGRQPAAWRRQLTVAGVLDADRRVGGQVG